LKQFSNTFKQLFCRNSFRKQRIDVIAPEKYPTAVQLSGIRIRSRMQTTVHLQSRVMGSNFPIESLIF